MEFPPAWIQCPAPLFPNQSLPRAHFELKVGGPHFPAAFHAPTDALIRRSPPLPPPTRTLLLRVLRALALPFCSSASHLSLSSPISAHPFPSPRLALKGIVSLSFHCVAHNDVIARKIQRYFTPHRRIRGEIGELIIARSPLSLT